MVRALFDSLVVSLRLGPVYVRLAAQDGRPAQAATLSAFRLPENAGAISISLTASAAPVPLPAGGVAGRERFEDVASMLMSRAEPGALELALLELDGLGGVRGGASEQDRAVLEHRLAGVLRAEAHNGTAATELGADRFAIIRARRGEGREVLAERVGRLMGFDPGMVRAGAQLLSMDARHGPQRAARALRYALDGFLRDGLSVKRPKSLATMLDQAVEHTLGEAGELGAAIRDRRFRLVYQPVVTLSDGRLHHYETLVRFGDDGSPYPLIRMAEEMELIEGLDRAIFEQALAEVARKPDLKLAINISGRTITSPDFVDHACRLLASEARARGRLMIELTESAAIADFMVADRHLKALRAQGCEICLDDFGAGAASLAYLQQLQVDVVKIDGRYIRDLQHGGREATFIKHLVSMCGELGVQTLAEMVETPAAEDAVRRAGVDMAQGWLYGAPLDTPEPPKGGTIKPRLRPGLSR